VPTYQLILEYDGTEFHGWQQQADTRTVAGVVADSLRRLTGEDVAMTAAGRTDAGAHAHGQVVGVSLQRGWDPAALRAALNASLPPDVAVVDALLRENGFHARRDALDRTYRYLIVSRGERAPVLRRHAWIVRGALHVRAMRTAARHLIGTHDFAAFGSATHRGGSTVRTVHEIGIDHNVFASTEDGPAFDTYAVSVRADAFLRGMMRAFAGALVRVGQGRAAPSWLAEILAGSERSPSLTPAPAHGLHQWSVRYGPYTLRRAAT
jgi:tRNA pseudouridine38-40 synthase